MQSVGNYVISAILLQDQDPKPKETKPSILSQHCVVFKFACDLWQIMLVMQPDTFINALPNTSILKKCHGKFDCLVYEMLFIKELRPSLITQSDSLFV